MHGFKNLLPSKVTELFKYQILVQHLKLEEARFTADAFLNSPTPYTDTMTALHDTFGQTHQLALKKIASILESLDLDRPGAGNRVMLKVVAVLVHYGQRTLDTFAILDDGSERTMLLPAATKSIKGSPDDLPVRTERQDVQVLDRHAVSFGVSPVPNHQTSCKIDGTFTTSRFSLSQHTYLVDRLQKKFKHLCDIPIPTLRGANPSLLIGCDQPHLITPVEPVRLCPPGPPHTRLGRTLQGPIRCIHSAHIVSVHLVSAIKGTRASRRLRDRDAETHWGGWCAGSHSEDLP